MASIDLSKLPPPQIIEPLSFDQIFNEMVADLKARLIAGGIEWDVDQLETDPLIVTEEARSARELLLRARINAAIRAVLAPTARGTNLDSVAARQGIQRLVIVPADPISQKPAVMEGDESLLRRYMLSFEKPAAGSSDRYKLEAYTAFPTAGDVAVIGRVVIGKLGEVEVIVSGPGGRDATDREMSAVRARVTADNVVPEGTSVSLVRATRIPYSVNLELDITEGPDPALIISEAIRRVRAAADERTKIAAIVPANLLPGAANGPNVIQVFDLNPVSIAGSPRSVPFCVSINVRQRNAGS